MDYCYIYQSDLIPQLKKDRRKWWNSSACIKRNIINIEDKEWSLPGYEMAWHSTLAPIVHSRTQQSILDVGTGTGSLACVYSKLGLDVTAIDISAIALRYARARACQKNLKIKFRYGDAESPRFPANTFDIISNRNILPYLFYPGRAFSAWSRILRSGGKIILILPSSIVSQSRFLKIKYKIEDDFFSIFQNLLKTSEWKAYNNNINYKNIHKLHPLRDKGPEMYYAMMEAAGFRNIKLHTDYLIHNCRIKHSPRSKILSLDSFSYHIITAIKY